MAMYAGKVKNDGNWDDNTSLGALLEKKFSALSFKQPESDADKEYNKKIAFKAQAEAIIEHIVANMEIKGIETKWKVGTEMGATTDKADPGDHSHTLTLSVEEGSEVIFPQKGTGYVE